MKRNKVLILAALLSGLACGTGSYVKLKLEIPSPAPFRLEQFKEIVIVNFIAKTEVKEFNLGQEIRDYLLLELRRDYKGAISSKDIVWEKEDQLKSDEFLKSFLTERQNALLVTGKAEYQQELRKAILEKEKKSLDDTFASEKRLAERLVFTLQLDLRFVRAESGETLFQKDYKEVKTYENTKQRADFAFYELMQNVKTKLFRSLLGSERIQERYLLPK